MQNSETHAFISVLHAHTRSSTYPKHNYLGMHTIHTQTHVPGVFYTSDAPGSLCVCPRASPSWGTPGDTTGSNHAGTAAVVGTWLQVLLQIWWQQKKPRRSWSPGQVGSKLGMSKIMGVSTLQYPQLVQLPEAGTPCSSTGSYFTNYPFQLTPPFHILQVTVPKAWDGDSRTSFWGQSPLLDWLAGGGGG